MTNFIASPATLLVKVSVSVMYLQTSQRLLPDLNEPTVLSTGYNFALTTDFTGMKP